MDGLRVAAPAKVNWTLEVLHIRPDGYHEIRSIMQTIDLYDVLTLTPSRTVDVAFADGAGAITDMPAELNLAYQAAIALRDAVGSSDGVRIEIEKAIPVAAGLGGGSSDAAAVIRGLNVLWSLERDEGDLIDIGARVGSDVPFFIAGGTAAVGGRGELVDPLPDALSPPLLLCAPHAGERANKTASMFAVLDASRFTEGDATMGVREAVEAGRAVTAAQLSNVFESVTSSMQPETERALDALRAQKFAPRLCGAGPSFFVLLDDPDATMSLIDRVRELDFEPTIVNPLPRADALAFEVL
jgi:4-diphosphocytidyl-2-C-methyl-D-erythritol kinase